MLHQLTLQKPTRAEPELDHRHLQALGLEHVRRLARRIWTDHNVHDPGITTLELLCYALTDLGYRASFPIEDLLASETGNAEGMRQQFFTARQILPGRPLTLLDYRKLLIDLAGVKNAWIHPHEQTLHVDPVAATLSTEAPATPIAREVRVRGLYRVLVELMDDVAPEDAEGVLAAASRRLQANRNLCEDFVDVAPIETQSFLVCAELELAPDAPVAAVHAEVLFRIQQYLAPPVNNYSLSEMLERRRSDGSRFTMDEIFDGPLLDHGFIDDEELAQAELRAEIRLSDVISLVMDIEGVRAVRDIVINPSGATAPLPDRWRVPVLPGRRPALDRAASRVVMYKRGVPVSAAPGDVTGRYDELASAARVKQETPREDDAPIPLGSHRRAGRYHSFQNHYPAIYGLGDQGLPGAASAARTAQARQLKAYLLFFDQIMANYCAQLARVKELFSTDPELHRTYFYQAVDSFAEWRQIYGVEDVVQTIQDEIEDPAVLLDRRSRFLDHLVARFAERFHDYAAVMTSAFGASSASAESILRAKCEFLRSYPAISADRGLAYDASLSASGDVWNTGNVSGLEKRLARLLGLPDASRRDLGAGGEGEGEEGMFLIENLLLRLPGFEAPRLPICADPRCTDCSGDDPYSYRVHVVLPAYAGRFRNMEFRRYAEEVIRQETPAHILPKICWVDRDAMIALEAAYRAWLEARAAGAGAAELAARLEALIGPLYAAKNVYPTERLRPCGVGDEGPKFILSRTRLGSVETEEG
ncbi:diguanylate cyclase [Sorangium sp. So ce1078]|uniref:diguanylate cyclase n=1 Tax=Sorangium sp. So ce1078 TaxID=3133329 RepID=UPI003F643919